MFVAIRDIRFAKGRFALMGSVVALITLLIVLLSGLTAGLADESVSAIEDLPADRIAFGASDDGRPEESFSDSSVTADQVDAWSSADGVEWAAPLGIVQTRMETARGGSDAITVFGVRPADGIAPAGLTGDGGAVVVSRSIAEDRGIGAGDGVTVAGRDLTVDAVADTASYSHTPVVWTTLDTWRALDPRGPRAEDGGEAGGGAAEATVIAAKTRSSADTGAVDDAAGTVSTTVSGSLGAIGSFSSENGSLLTMQGFLYAISALVIGAFLTVWTIQRSGDVAILKALGGSTGYLLRDALAQALIVLVAGTALGGAVGFATGALAMGSVPFELTPTTTVLPVAAMVALGMLGAVLAVRRITSVDPLTALGGVR
ncbi:putative ABC transport system permease protein [Spinactinospora alkalitolerans]|uniref:Putative ABC transport system permease protein n=1 Tax=Spinactinospora alkalitolerans TaxID=687207 RepID=A0A852TN33_9ACTN|nr:ABC transporter permease [Spinactinospora alkalitolerans]NYE45369.1 putative ABC transport system permease protein [Spinactinospora alkalitolerans]